MVSEHLISVKDLVKRIPTFTESTIRWWIFNASENGLNKSLIKVGGRVYVDLQAFDIWLEEQRVSSQ